jgi:paraquat-inducible protein A
MTIVLNDISGVEACPDCDMLYTDVTLPPGKKLRCSRCGTTLRIFKRNSVDKALAMSLTGLLLYIPAMTLPIMTISVVGLTGTSSVIDSLIIMYRTGFPFVGSMVLLVCFLFPLIKLALLFWASLSLKIGRSSNTLPLVFRTYKHLAEWGMVEVYMLGILISIIKMHSMGTLDFNPGFYSFSALFLITVGSSVVVDKRLFWKLIEGKGKEEQSTPPADTFDQSGVTAREAGFVRCHDCGKVVRQVAVGTGKVARCPRCRAELHSRKNRNVSATWALVICAIVLFLPANILPIMSVDFLGSTENSTIMDGIIYFFTEGEYLIGAVILIASVLVPLFKIVGILIILLSIHFHWHGWLKHKAKMFRFVEFIGRWSFLDIFVIAFMASMVQFGFLSTIGANPAARYFTAVVIVTMFAAITFDPRILWDACLQTDKEKGEKCLKQL